MTHFSRAVLNHKLYVLPTEIKHNINIDSLLLEKLRFEVGNKCIKEGFVKKNNIEILKRSIGLVDCIHFNARVCYHITYTAEICNPMDGTIIEGAVSQINKMGALVVVEPISIVLPKQHHGDDLSIFKTLQIGDRVEIRIIGSNYELFDKTIEAAGIIQRVLN